MKEYIDSILISKKKRILNKGGNDYLLTIQLITGFHRLNYILSFERDQLILIENEEKSHTKSLCEFVKPLGSSTLQKKKKKAIFQQWSVEKRGILELLRCDSPGKIALVNTFRADVAAAMLRIVDKFRV